MHRFFTHCYRLWACPKVYKNKVCIFHQPPPFLLLAYPTKWPGNKSLRNFSGFRNKKKVFPRGSQKVFSVRWVLVETVIVSEKWCHWKLENDPFLLSNHPFWGTCPSKKQNKTPPKHVLSDFACALDISQAQAHTAPGSGGLERRWGGTPLGARGCPSQVGIFGIPFWRAVHIWKNLGNGWI